MRWQGQHNGHLHLAGEQTEPDVGEMTSSRSPSELGLEPRVLSGSKFRVFSTKKVGETGWLGWERMQEVSGPPADPSLALTVPSLGLDTCFLEVPDVLWLHENRQPLGRTLCKKASPDLAWILFLGSLSFWNSGFCPDISIYYLCDLGHVASSH